MLMNKIFFSLIILISGYAIELPHEENRSPIVYGEVDYLLWFANGDGLHYPTVATGSSPNLGSKWSSGVRAAIGITPSCFDTKLCYTYYNTNSYSQVNANIETILTSFPSTAGIFEVDAKWSLNFNRLDWEFGRKILFGHNFLLRPYFGLEGLIVDQKFHLNTDTVFLNLDDGLQATDIIESKNKNALLSIGAEGGFNAHFCLGRGFEFYGNFAGSILWGKFRMKQNYNQTDYFSSGNSNELIDQTKELSQGGSIFNCDLGIGFDWRHYFQKSKLELLLKFGWEQHYYTDIVRFQDFYLQQVSAGSAAYLSNGNLSLSGFTFGILLIY